MYSQSRILLDPACLKGYPGDHESKDFWEDISLVFYRFPTVCSNRIIGSPARAVVLTKGEFGCG